METKSDVLKKYFGHSSFRCGQEQIVDCLLSRHDALCIMPTGAGKSVCYQVPALLFDGITIVISPLISLMKDQVSALCQSGVAAAYLNSSLSYTQYNKALQNVTVGKYKILYVAPERLGTGEFIRACKKIKISMVAVDEAHCVSRWGQDFRPSYLKITEFIEQLPSRPVVGAFTATATKAVKEDVIKILKLNDPLVITTGFDRPNLFFSVAKPQSKPLYLLGLLSERHEASGIIYCSTRKTVEEVCSLLNKRGYPATRYHAGLSDDERKKNQDDFVFDKKPIMVATNAFGMGIDKSNVSYVIHYNMPKDIESYYQEAGRAGRDGEEADCILLYSPQDVTVNKFLISKSESGNDLSDQEKEVNRKRDLDRLKYMTFYSTTNDCLRHFILRYFGDISKTYCEKCSNCLTKRGYLKLSGNEYPALNITPSSAGALHGKVPITVNNAEKQQKVKSPDYELDSSLLNMLKELRHKIALKQSVPAYAVFTDASLIDMCRKLPRSTEDFLNISGVGKAKLDRYGEAFIDAITAYTTNREHTPIVQTGTNESPTQNIQDSYHSWSAAEIVQLKSEINDGLPIKEIADAHGRTVGAIRCHIKKEGLILRAHYPYK